MIDVIKHKQETEICQNHRYLVMTTNSVQRFPLEKSRYHISRPFIILQSCGFWILRFLINMGPHRSKTFKTLLLQLWTNKLFIGSWWSYKGWLGLLFVNIECCGSERFNKAIIKVYLDVPNGGRNKKQLVWSDTFDLAVFNVILVSANALVLNLVGLTNCVRFPTIVIKQIIKAHGPLV